MLKGFYTKNSKRRPIIGKIQERRKKPTMEDWIPTKPPPLKQSKSFNLDTFEDYEIENINPDIDKSGSIRYYLNKFNGVSVGNIRRIDNDVSRGKWYDDKIFRSTVSSVDAKNYENLAQTLREYQLRYPDYKWYDFGDYGSVKIYGFPDSIDITISSTINDEGFPYQDEVVSADEYIISPESLQSRANELYEEIRRFKS